MFTSDFLFHIAAKFPKKAINIGTLCF